MSDDCVFCRIVRKDISVELVHDGEECIAFRDANPQAPIHFLVIPRAHIPTLNDARDAALVGRLSLVAAELAKRDGVAESGYRIVMNTNGAAGQTVFHLHLHVLGGRSLSWPPG